MNTSIVVDRGQVRDKPHRKEISDLDRGKDMWPVCIIIRMAVFHTFQSLYHRIGDIVFPSNGVSAEIQLSTAGKSLTRGTHGIIYEGFLIVTRYVLAHL